MNNNQLDWHPIDRALDADTDNWRELAIIGGVTPQELESVLPAFTEPIERRELEEELKMYQQEVEHLIRAMEDLPREARISLTKVVLNEVWKLPVQPKRQLSTTVEGLVRQQSPPVAIALAR